MLLVIITICYCQQNYKGNPFAIYHACEKSLPPILYRHRNQVCHFSRQPHQQHYTRLSPPDSHILTYSMTEICEFSKKSTRKPRRPG